MALIINSGKGITLQQLNSLVTKTMQKFAKSTSNVTQEITECKGKTAREIAEMVSKKDVVALSPKNRIATTPFVEIDLSHNAAYKDLRGVTANRIYSDGSTVEIKKFYNKLSGEPEFNEKHIEFANGNKRTYYENFKTSPTEKAISSWHIDDNGYVTYERNYRKFVDKNGQKLSFVNYFQEGSKPLSGTLHINDKKVHFERVKDSTGELTNAYKAKIKDGNKIETIYADNAKNLAEQLGISETCFWR